MRIITDSFNRLFNRDPVARDAARIQGLKKQLSRTEAGRTLLNHAKEKNISITFDHSPQFQHDGQIAGNTLYLSPQQDDKALIGILAREIRQHHINRNLPYIGLPPPQTYVETRTMEEADKRAFQTKFLEDFARKTGDKTPLEKSFPHLKDRITGKNDKERFHAWKDILSSPEQYKYNLQNWEYLAAAQKGNRKHDYIAAPEDAQRITVNQLCASDTIWPFPQKDGRYSYLRCKSLGEIDEVMTHPSRSDPLVTKELATAEATHKTAYDAQQKEDHAAVDKLKERFGRSRAGQALLDFAEENGISISTDRNLYAQSGNSGTYEHRTKQIKYDPAFMSEEDTIVLLAHELRHAWQHTQLEEKDTWLSPRELAAKTRFLEADAYHFQQNFVRDYARETGDNGPREADLKESLENDGRPMIDEDMNDQDSFRAWCAYLTGHNTYDPNAASLADRRLTAHSEDPISHTLLTEDESRALALHTARAIDRPWPLESKDGKEHYLAGINDEELTRLGFKQKSELTAVFTALNARHRQQLGAAPIAQNKPVPQ